MSYNPIPFQPRMSLAEFFFVWALPEWRGQTGSARLPRQRKTGQADVASVFGLPRDGAVAQARHCQERAKLPILAAPELSSPRFAAVSFVLGMPASSPCGR